MAQKSDHQPVVEEKLATEPLESAPADDNEAKSALPDFQSIRKQSRVVDTALTLKESVEVANRDDLHRLWAPLQDFLRPLNPEARQRFARQVQTRMDADAALLKRAQTYFRDGPGSARWWDAIELRKAVDQFLGIPDEAVGIYQDAHRLMDRPTEKNPFNPELGDLYIEPYFTAGLKTLLLYAALVADRADNIGQLELSKDLQLVYPVPVPTTVPAGLFEGHALLDVSNGDPVFWIPNAGFVMGGTFVDGENRGVDCSAFVSHCTDRSDRLTTWVMEFCWRELANGPESFRGNEREIRKEFLDQWGLKQALEDYQAVEFNDLSDLEAGDVLVRRWGDSDSGGREGNSTIYLANRDDGTILGIECNRLYYPQTGERMDGVILRVYDLFQPNVDVYVLRRRW